MFYLRYVGAMTVIIGMCLLICFDFNTLSFLVNDCIDG